MTKEQRIEQAEDFVTRVVKNTFKQKVDPEVVRATARKLARSVEIEPDNKSSDYRSKPLA